MSPISGLHGEGYRMDTIEVRPWNLYEDLQKPILKVLGLADYPVTELDLHLDHSRVTLKLQAEFTSNAAATIAEDPRKARTKFE